MSLGFQEAGFNILAGFEHWNTAISCYKKNFSHPVEDVDLSDVDLSVKTIAKYTPDIIIGGPPCQDFSGAGNRIKNVNIKIDIFSCFYCFAILHNTQPILLYIFTFRQRSSKAATAASLSRSLYPLLCKLLYLFLE